MNTAPVQRLGLLVRRWNQLCLMAAVGIFTALPAFAQDSISTSHTTTTSSTSSEFVSDWRLWALVGAVILIIIIVALTRRGGGDSTTIVK